MIGTGAERVAKGKVVALGLLLVAFMAASLLVAKPAQTALPNVFTVDSTADTNLTACTAAADDCTLRGAINAANSTANSAGPDKIEFAISGGGPHTISPTTELPTIIQPVTINGYSQSGASVNTATDGTTNAVLMIQLSGLQNSPGLNGLTLGNGAGGTTIRGLVINSFKSASGSAGGRGIFLLDVPNNSNNKIEGNFIGTSAGGVFSAGNDQAGVFAFGQSTNNTIGGTGVDKRNIVSNNPNGIALLSDGNTVHNNIVGSDKTGTLDEGNNLVGVRVSGSNNVVSDNHIAFNGGSGPSGGVLVFSGTGNRIQNNSIHDNNGLGIDLADNGSIPGVTANDGKDPDTGANNLQNFPVITSAAGSSGTTTITGTLNSTKKKNFTIQFFASPAADPSGFGEGQTFLGQRTVKTNKKGKASFTFAANGDLSGQSMTATATNDSTGDTSEFSAAVPVS